MNEDLRKQIVEMVYNGREGHIPSAFSIIDILEALYGNFLKYDSKKPTWKERDYFVLSKGHGCIALYVLLKRHCFITKQDINDFCTPNGILGEHPDTTKVPGIEASTGSLGHGLPQSVGIALGLRLNNMNNKVYVLIGDGECHEGTIWESANIVTNLELGNLCCIVDLNGSAQQLMPKDNIPSKFKSFGWNCIEIDGHNREEIHGALRSIKFSDVGIPTVIVARTVKGKGVKMIEGHGPWHHKIPTEEEYRKIMEELE